MILDKKLHPIQIHKKKWATNIRRDRVTNVKRKAVPLFQPRSGYGRSGTASLLTLVSRLMLVAKKWLIAV